MLQPRPDRKGWRRPGQGIEKDNGVRENLENPDEIKHQSYEDLTNETEEEIEELHFLVMNPCHLGYQW